MRYLDRKRRKRPSSGPYSRLDKATPGRQTVPVTSRDLKRLADAVMALRTELGLSQEAFAERAGTGRDRMSVKTLQRIEAAAVDPRPKTLGALDRAAGWTPGHARSLVEGEEVPPEPAAPTSRPTHEPKPEDYPDEHEYMNAVYWYLRQWMSHDAVMRGFHMAATIYERKNAERNAPKAPGNKVG